MVTVVIMMIMMVLVILRSIEGKSVDQRPLVPQPQSDLACGHQKTH